MKLSPEDRLTLQTIKTQLTDADSEWWPFVFLRPNQDERLTTTRCAVLALLYGVPAALIAVVGGRLLGDELTSRHAALFSLCISLLVFSSFRWGMAPFWNHRAQYLSSLSQRRAEWQQSISK